MKNILFIIALNLVAILSFSPSSSAYQFVKIENKQLLTDFDQDGVYSPYLIKGVAYLPTPITRYPSDWGYSPAVPGRANNIFADFGILDRDFPLISAMKANTIRIWGGQNAQVTAADLNDPGSSWYGQSSENIGRVTNYITQRTLDRAQANGLKVIAGFWLNPEGYWTCTPGGSQFNVVTDYANTDVRNYIKQKFTDYVIEWKDHPAILFWAIGNEVNLSFGDSTERIRAYFTLVNEMAALAHQIEGENAHPVALVNGDIGYIGDANVFASDEHLNHIDIWGANVYRGNGAIPNGISLGTVFDEFAQKSQKVFWVSEFGIDSWHSDNPNDPLKEFDQGHEDQNAQAQTDAKLWDEIKAAFHKNKTIGATVMNYSDNWWAPYEFHCGEGSISCNMTQNHFGFGPTDNSCPADGTIDWTPPAPDLVFNEEWWGVVKIAPNPEEGGVDIVSPRSVYMSLQQKFNQPLSTAPVLTVTPQTDNGQLNSIMITVDATAQANLRSVYWFVEDINNPSNQNIPGSVRACSLFQRCADFPTNLKQTQDALTCQNQTSCSYVRTITFENPGSYRIKVFSRDIFYPTSNETHEVSKEITFNPREPDENTPPQMDYLLQGWFKFFLFWQGSDKEDGKNLSYQYRLNGGAWSQPNTTQWIAVKKLPLTPGSNTFEIRAIDSKGSQSVSKSIQIKR